MPDTRDFFRVPEILISYGFVERGAEPCGLTIAVNGDLARVTGGIASLIEKKLPSLVSS
jgi:hypothetical protein